MKRKAFVFTASAVIVGLPVAYYLKKNKYTHAHPLSTPGLLSIFCDEKTLRSIGEEYKKLVPQENSKQKLTDILLMDSGGKKIKSTDTDQVQDLMDTKVKNDFLNNNLLIIKDWVISVTEARQCTLLSLT